MKVKLRPWQEFADSSAFKLPNNDDISERVSTNLVHFQANYFAIFILLMLYAFIARPRFLLGSLITFGLGVYIFGVRTRPIVFQGRVVQRKEAILSYMIICLVTIIIFGGSTGLLSLCLSVLIILMHAMLRQRSLAARATKFLDMFGGSSLVGKAIREIVCSPLKFCIPFSFVGT